MTSTSSPFRTAEQKLEDRAAKRNAVLRAAVQMFNARGFHATSLDDVAASLGISKPTIYHYLGNKDQILLECLKLGLQQLLEAVAQARTLPGSGFDRLVRFLECYAEVMMGDFGRCVIRTPQESLTPQSLPEYRDIKRKIDAAMRELIEEGIADGSIAALDSRLLSFTLAGALNWTARWHNPDGEQDVGEIASTMVDILANGFTPANRPPPG